MAIRHLLSITLILLCSSQAWANEPDVDPWEGLNRKVDTFNHFGDKWLVRPVAVAYDFVTPDVVDDGVTNMFHNLREPITIVNDLFQLKFKKAGKDTGRLLINSTVGLLGFFDVAAKAGLEREVEDFGQTLGYWGVPPGPYVVLPFLGPSSLRDGLSLFPDSALNPISTPVTAIDHELTQYSVLGGYYVDLRADLLDADDLISGDRYIFLRDAYLQNREFLVTDGEVEDDFGDEDF